MSATKGFERPRQDGGFTLLELLVAIALAALISAMISVVSTEGQKIYISMTEKVEVYQKFRYAFRDLERTLQNMVVTADLEFFVDTPADIRGHWEEGEEYKDLVNLDGGRPDPRRYDEGALVIQRSYTVDGDPAEVEHDNFSVYFKAVTEIDGIMRVANVEYYLAEPSELAAGRDGRIGKSVAPNAKPGSEIPHVGFVLVKVVRYVVVPDINSPTDRKVKKSVVELCQNVTDFRVEYFYDNVFDAAPGGFVVPEMERNGEVRSETGVEVLADGGYLKEFLYGGWRNIRKGGATRALRNSETGDLVPVSFDVGSATSGINFSELRYGDKIFIWNEAGGSEFPNRDYTVQRNESGRLHFVENIDSSGWRANISGLRFRAGYVPSQFRVTMHVLNDKGGEPRRQSLVIHPIRKH
ncbi:MAG: prepilin-type N-terminal cleavage/methylation domain-containing protein [Planctomycetota bacterium]